MNKDDLTELLQNAMRDVLWELSQKDEPAHLIFRRIRMIAEGVLAETDKARERA